MASSKISASKILKAKKQNQQPTHFNGLVSSETILLIDAQGSLRRSSVDEKTYK